MVGSVVTAKLLRGDATSPWGFRLQGGKDWGTALCISKVNPGSLAEQAGLQVGDFIVSIHGKSADVMLHKEAQDTILKAGNNLEIQVQRGGTLTWKPAVTPVGTLPKPSKTGGSEPQLVTKTSLAHLQQETKPIGTGHNSSAKPFSPLSPNSNMQLVHKQFNSPLNIYSMQNIAETIKAHSEVLSTGVKGINFMKPDAPVNKESAVYRAILEEEQKSKGDYNYNYNQQDHGRISVSPTAQSHAFRRIQQSLDVDEEQKSGVVNQPSSPTASPRIGFPAHPFTKHVDAPITKPKSENEPSVNTCGECGRLIVGVFCRVKDKNLHAECFKCATCGTSLKNVGYFSVNEKLYCDVHAKQAAKMMAAPDLEPLTIRPGAPIPNNVSVIGLGANPPENCVPNAPIISGSPKITIPPQTGAPQPSGKLSPSVMGAVPWHSPAGVHHVNAPQSPGLMPSLISPTPPPVAPKPQFKLSGGSPNLYQSHPHPYTAPSSDIHRPIQGGAKFTWPPPKSAVIQDGLADGDGKQLNSAFRSPIGTQHVACESNKVTADARTSSYFSQTSITQTSGQTLSTPGPGQSSVPGSRPAPRRGRGQLKPQAGPGARVPICSICGTPIRGPFIVALGKTWCPEHFTCANGKCRRNLEDCGFVEEQGQLYCENCFESYLAPICAKCNVRIKGDCLMALDKQWHPGCFICGYCRKPFGNNSFYLEDGQPYCEKDWNDLFTTKCVGCGYPIEAGDRWVEALNNNYHSLCFKCTVCHKNLEGQSFYAKGGRPYCKSHAR